MHDSHIRRCFHKSIGTSSTKESFSRTAGVVSGSSDVPSVTGVSICGVGPEKSLPVMRDNVCMSGVKADVFQLRTVRNE